MSLFNFLNFSEFKHCFFYNLFYFKRGLSKVLFWHCMSRKSRKHGKSMISWFHGISMFWKTWGLGRETDHIWEPSKLSSIQKQRQKGNSNQFVEVTFLELSGISFLVILDTKLRKRENKMYAGHCNLAPWLIKLPPCKLKIMASLQGKLNLVVTDKCT